MNETKGDEIKARWKDVDAKRNEAKAQEDKLQIQQINNETAFVWKGEVEQLKEQVIEAATPSEALQLEVDTLK